MTSKAAFIAWAIIVAILVLITPALAGLSQFMFHTFSYGILAAVIAWALGLGLFLLLFFPAKILTALFGFLVGGGLGEIGTGQALVTFLRKGVIAIVAEITTVGQPLGIENETLVAQATWIFVVILIIATFPRFFMED